MKQLLFQPLLLLALLAGWGARAQTLLQSQSFENGEAVNYTATSLPQDNTTTCPGNVYCSTSATTAQRYNQYFQRVNESTSPYTLPTSPSNVWPLQPTTGAGLDGTYFWAAEGIRGGQSITARPPAVLKLNSITTVAGKANLQVKVALLAGRASLQPYNNTNDSIRVQVRLNGSSTWSTIGQFTGDGSGNMAQTKGNSSNPATLTEQMTDFTFDVGSSANSMETRVVIANRTSEELAFDNIRVYGTAVSGTPPVVANVETTSLNYAEGQAATPITQAITVSDADSPTLNSGTVQFTSGYTSTEDMLLFASQLGITGNFSQSTGVLTLTGPASLASFQAAFRAVAYQNTNTITARAGDRIVSFSVTDPTNLTSSPDTRTIAVTTALDAASGLPYVEDLENNGEGTRYASNNTSATLTNGRAFLRTSVASEPNGQWHTNGSAATTISGINNSNYWWASGTDVLSGGVGTFITKQVNTAGYTNLNFSVKLAASNNVWENVQHLKVYYRLGGSSGTWIPMLSFRSSDQTSTVNQASTTGNLRQDANPATTTGVPAGAQLTPTLTTYSATLPTTANGQLVDFKIDALSKFADGVGEVIAFDNLQLTGTATTTVNSIARASANPTNAATVNYTVTFGAPVTGLTASNFSLTTTGTVSGASVGTPVAGSGNTTWTVPVNTGTGSGTLTLNLANDINLSVDITTTLPFAGETYTIDKTAPTVSSVTVPANGAYRANQALGFAVNFSEAVTVTGTPQLALTIGSTTRQATYVSGSGTTALAFNYTVQSGELDPNGIVVGSALTLNGGTIRDAVGNDAALTLNGVPSTAGILVDAVAPTVTSSVRQNPTTATTGATSLTFRVTFSEAVTGVTTSSFTFTTTTGSTTGSIASVAAVSGSNGTQYDVAVNSVSGNGTVRLDVKSSGTGIIDAAGNGLKDGYTGGETYTVSQSVTVVSVTRLTPSFQATATAQVSYQVVFSGNVTNLTVNNFTTGSTVANSGVSSVSGSGTTYTVIVNTGTGSGTLRLNVANATGISPTVTNTPYTSGETYSIVRSFAAAPKVVLRANGSVSGNYNDVTAFVDVVQVLQSGIIFAAGLQNSSFENNNVGLNGALYQQTGVVAAPWAFTTQAGVSRNNSGFGSTAFSGDAVALLQSFNGTNGSVSQNLAVPTGSYQVSLQASQRTNNSTSDQAVNVFLNNGLDDVFLGSIQPPASGAYQLFTSAAFSVTAPAVTATVSTTSASPTSTAPIPFAVSFSQSVGTTFAAADVTVTGGTLNTASFSGSGAGPYTFTVAPTGGGTVTVSLATGVATDANNTDNTASNAVSVQFQPLGLSSVVPAAELPGQVVTLTGTGFTSGSTVQFGTTAASVTYGSTTTLTALVPAGLSAGSAPVSVSTGGVTTAAQPFTALAVYDGGSPNACAAAVAATASVGDGAWHYLLSPAGQVVAAYNYSGASLGNLALDVLRADPTQPVRQDGGQHYYLDRNWHLTASAGRFDGRMVQLRLYGLNTEQARLQYSDPTATLTNLKANQYSGSNEDCQLANNSPSGESRILPAPATSPAGTSYFVAQLSVADHFSEFYLTGSPTPLPVELTKFTATLASPTTVRLAWTTASELHSDRFEVERSLDGQQFVRVGSLAAAGSSVTARRYELLDAQLPVGATLLYYRLRQVDWDGTFTYSPVRPVALPGAAAGLALFPNPVHGAATLTGAQPGAAVTVLDALGRLVLTAPADATGTAVLPLPTGLAPGVYLVRVGAAALRLSVTE